MFAGTTDAATGSSMVSRGPRGVQCVQVVATVEQQLGITGRVAGALHRVPVAAEPEHERIAHLGDGRVVRRADLDHLVLVPLA